jgi:formate dehydrogenase subunit delta
MSHEKIARMANQIATFFTSKPHDEGVAGVAEHINKFWEPRMRRQFFEIVDGGGGSLMPLAMEASALVRRPDAQPGQGPGAGDDANAGSPDGKGPAEGESVAEIAASQG